MAVVAYLPSLAGVFHFDDYNVIVHYPTVHSWEALLERAGGGVRPLLKASYTLNWTLGGGFSLFNIAVHAVNTALLFLIGQPALQRPQGRIDRGAAVRAPPGRDRSRHLHQRPLVLADGDVLPRRDARVPARHRIGLSALLFLLAVATRETAVTLPAALLLCELCRAERPAWREILRRQWPHWALLLAGGVFLLFNQRYFDLVAYGYGERGLADNLLTQVGGVSYLILRLVSLHGYNIDPALPTLTEWTPALALSSVCFSVCSCLGVANLRRRPWIAFGVLWFFLQLAPTNSIVPRLDVANDRQLYLASWGLFLALCIQLRNLPRFAVSVVLYPLRRRRASCASSTTAARSCCGSPASRWRRGMRAGTTTSATPTSSPDAPTTRGASTAAALLFDPRHAKARLNLHVPARH